MRSRLTINQPLLHSCSPMLVSWGTRKMLLTKMPRQLQMGNEPYLSRLFNVGQYCIFIQRGSHSHGLFFHVNIDLFNIFEREIKSG